MKIIRGLLCRDLHYLTALPNTILFFYLGGRRMECSVVIEDLSADATLKE